MCKPNEVPLPYHTRVRSWCDETNEVTLDCLDTLGNWMKVKVDQAQFEAISGGTNIIFKPVDFEEDLIIDHEGICNGGEVHYSWQCNNEDTCYPIADAEYGDIDDLYEEYKNWSVYGDISPHMAAEATRVLLERARPSMMFEKFGQNFKNNFVDSDKQDKKDPTYITFRRYPGVKEKDQTQAEAASRSNTHSTRYGVAQRQIEIQ